MQHVCSFVINMERVAEKLIYRSRLDVVSIGSRGGVLRVASSEVDPTPLGLGFCGAHADIDGLEFPLSSKVK